MPEIKVNTAEASEAFTTLQDSINSFSEVSQQIPAGITDLKTIDDLREIQEIYSGLLKSYVDVLERVEKQGRDHIKDMEDTDEQLSQQSS
ncbi:YwqI/YxiC family protein [Salicibibacter cibarius]|uniref:YwqI/YxiC family protein n=1 Tax=Salicibibacter cibarius TaxID=2743000 RepID=A0A7T7CD33_9BACI|nr:DUF5344 family protein [Salicibibacter cibarius]QQK77594.1 YwqI/YxiC family protein [Salicibibacter cibarius]